MGVGVAHVTCQSRLEAKNEFLFDICCSAATVGFDFQLSPVVKLFLQHGVGQGMWAHKTAGKHRCYHFNAFLAKN